MFFFFGGRGLPPGLRRFLTGLMLGSVALFMFQGAARVPLSALSAGLIVLFAAWYAQRGDRERTERTEHEKRFNQRSIGHDYKPMYREERAPLVETHSPAQEAAERALRNAGHDPEALRLRLQDIGLMVYRGSNNPASVARLEAIRADASHLRPFVKLHSPLPKALVQEVTFEIVDEDGTAHFRNAGEYEVRPGANLLTPKNWLPLENLPIDGKWLMRVLVGETPLAIHKFKWRTPATAQSAQPEISLSSDGEIEDATSRLSRMPMSLDELLADQSSDDADEQQQARGSRRR
jgi:hypothetical protein